MSALAGASRGTFLGLINVFVIAVGLAVHEHDLEVMALVMIFGSVPGIVLGALLGLLAGGLSKMPVIGRLALLILPSLGLVSMLADEFAMSDYTLVAMIPTAVAGSILERWTRWREPPPLPVAHAHVA